MPHSSLVFRRGGNDRGVASVILTLWSLQRAGATLVPQVYLVTFFAVPVCTKIACMGLNRNMEHLFCRISYTWVFREVHYLTHERWLTGGGASGTLRF